MGTRIWTAVAALVWIASLAGAGTTSQVAARAVELPGGEGREIVQRACIDCHPADLIMANLWTRPEWERLVEEMIARGAPATPDEQPTIVAYLFSNFGRVNANRAPQDDLAAVLRLTADEAKAIVDHRANGEFTSLEDLKKVPGVDSTKLEARKAHITYGRK
jgi:competence protein ComEA